MRAKRACSTKKSGDCEAGYPGEKVFCKVSPHLGQHVRIYLCPPPSSVASERAFKVSKNVVGDTKLRLRPENVEINLFRKYNLRTVNYEIYQLETPPDTWPQTAWTETDYDSDDESMVTEFDEEGSEIEFTDESDEEDIL